MGSCDESDLLTFVPVIDLYSVLETENSDPHSLHTVGQKVLASLETTGCVVLRDPRVSSIDNSRFMDQMEAYFSRSAAEKAADVRRHLAYQVGATPEGIETPRCLFDTSLQAQIAAQPVTERAAMPSGPDVKWRYFWRIGQDVQPDADVVDSSEGDRMENVIPAGVPDWACVMETWGQKLLDTVLTVSKLLAAGLNLPHDTFTDMLHQGPHLLAPTGTDLEKHHKVGTVYAGYHYDLNFLTAHGRSRYPGLFVWLKSGKRIPVRLPSGCILVQAGRQLEWLTGGHIMAGMHEVVCSEATVESMKQADTLNRPLWRVSSTMFSHIRSDVVLAPLHVFGGAPALYEPISAGDFVQKEIEDIKLATR